MSASLHGPGPAPSAWVRRWTASLAPGARVLDLACGSGRHLMWLAARGLRVTGVDRDEQAVAPLRAHAEIVVADLEAGAWPLAGRSFDAVVVTNYLWRPLMPDIVGSVADGGRLVYETFMRGHEAYGRPSRPEFLLEPGELLRTTAPLRPVAYEEGLLEEPARLVQRVCAVRGGPAKLADSITPCAP